MLYVFPSRTQGHSACRLKFRQDHAVKEIGFVSGRETLCSKELMASSAPFLLWVVVVVLFVVVVRWWSLSWKVYLGERVFLRLLSTVSWMLDIPTPFSFFLSVPKVSHGIILRILQSKQTILLRDCLRDRDIYIFFFARNTEALMWNAFLETPFTQRGTDSPFFSPEGSQFIALVFITCYVFHHYFSG